LNLFVQILKYRLIFLTVRNQIVKFLKVKMDNTLTSI
jgi:hypothetical protein